MSQSEGIARNMGGNAVATSFVTLRDPDLAMLRRFSAISPTDWRRATSNRPVPLRYARLQKWLLSFWPGTSHKMESGFRQPSIKVSNLIFLQPSRLAAISLPADQANKFARFRESSH
jgi:hypothetical protein